jgi:hypothetical protein
MLNGAVGPGATNLENYFGDQFSDLTMRENYSGVD